PASAILPALSSFPTRRSSDLEIVCNRRGNADAHIREARERSKQEIAAPGSYAGIPGLFENYLGYTGDRSRERRQRHSFVDRAVRSEEHTSELQSRENLVCRLL